MEKLDIIIIGGGVIGLSILRQLSKYKTDVLLIEKDKDICNGTSKANSGIIHGGFDDKFGSTKSKYCPMASKNFEELDKELNFGYRKIGSLVLAYNDDNLKTLHYLHENGLKNNVKTEILDKNHVTELEPNLFDNVVAALHSKESGVVSPYEYGIALAENALENGAQISLNEKVLSIQNQNNEFFLTTSKRKIQTKILINSAGLFSDEISYMLGIEDIKIKPRKGQYIIFNRDTAKIVNHVLFQCPSKLGKGVLVSPTYHGNLLIGPSAKDIDSKTDTDTDIDTIMNMLKLAKKVVKNIPLPQALTTFSGLRPINGDGDFLIREKIAKFIELVGISSPGLSSSPQIALDVVNNYIKKHINLEEKSDFNPYRKATIQSSTSKNFVDIKIASELAKKDINQKDSLVCRCEQVSRQTIDDALDKGFDIDTVQSVKFRTRAGMGICQGNFCKSRVKKILSQKINKKEEDVCDINSDIRPNRVSRKDILKAIKYFN